jgi:hypothetical protein
LYSGNIYVSHAIPVVDTLAYGIAVASDLDDITGDSSDQSTLNILGINPGKLILGLQHSVLVQDDLCLLCGQNTMGHRHPVSRDIHLKLADMEEQNAFLCVSLD